jgi:cupin superfamily acireductone dioxygenase involved in methionine salvage
MKVLLTVGLVLTSLTVFSQSRRFTTTKSELPTTNTTKINKSKTKTVMETTREFKTINVLELASELADAKVRELIVNFSDIYIEDEFEVRYTEKAQEYFNEWYDIYTELIESM